jgi:hypothetical protein
MKYAFFLLIGLTFGELSAQDGFSVLAGGFAGIRKVEASDFRGTYGNSKFTYGAVLGVGNGETYLAAKYRLMSVADGSTTVSGVNYSASWKERIIVAGFHYYPARIPFRFEAGYAWLFADENLTPKAGFASPIQSRTIKDRGIDLVGGMSMGHDIRLNLDLGYLLLFKDGSASSGSLPNLGGFYYGASFCYLL